MKKLLIFLFGLSLVFTFNSVSFAVPFEFKDVNAPSGGIVSSAQPYSHTFDLDDDTLELGDINLGDTIITASLFLHFDSTTNKKIDLTLDSGTTQFFAINLLDYSFDVLAKVVSDHELLVELKPHDSGSGTSFNLSQVEVSGTYSPAIDPVPEPVSMLLFGTGLVGVGGYMRRKFKN